MIELINKPKLLNSKRLKKWLLDCSIRYNVEIERLSIFFVDNKRIHQLNRKFLNHDYATDILTFPYKSTKQIEAEIFISIEKAQENAINFSQTIENELIRLISHGFLHLNGYCDSTPDQKRRMTKKEDEMINMFHVEHKASKHV
ncbi:MAG: rRNA maturation RNase YbeY [Candidatus Marivariicella sp.]|tara:strand:+ start:519 stop:950 length:432 start_codon:yes stop_codon:yes gene_type:complete